MLLFPIGAAAAAPTQAMTANATAAATSASASMASATTEGLARMSLATNFAFDPSAPLGSAANPIPHSSPTPASLAYALVAGEPNVVTNGPIPDTRANRAMYGSPLSHAGRASDPAGN